jgi:hypothetical protein
MDGREGGERGVGWKAGTKREASMKRDRVINRETEAQTGKLEIGEVVNIRKEGGAKAGTRSHEAVHTCYPVLGRERKGDWKSEADLGCVMGSSQPRLQIKTLFQHTHTAQL